MWNIPGAQLCGALFFVSGKHFGPLSSVQWFVWLAGMPEEQIPLDEYQRPGSSSSSAPRSRQPSVGELQENGPHEHGGGHFVAIRNMLNATRYRPVARIAPLEPSFVPAPQRYFPIVIPAEPTIEELLVGVAGGDLCQCLL